MVALLTAPAGWDAALEEVALVMTLVACWYLHVLGTHNPLSIRSYTATQLCRTDGLAGWQAGRLALTGADWRGSQWLLIQTHGESVENLQTNTHTHRQAGRQAGMGERVRRVRRVRQVPAARLAAGGCTRGRAGSFGNDCQIPRAPFHS